MNRLPDWQSRLADAIRAASERPFSYGGHDCCLAVCDCVLAETGIDLADDIRGYCGKSEAVAVLKRYGGVAGLCETKAKIHRLAEVPPLQAQRGDVVITLERGRDTLGIVDLGGRVTLSAAAPKGWGERPLREASRAWRIG
ncbi:hypothetical protein [Pelagibius sp.]|uniref:DUF6950 family protein n=1 Tax=Pelagibius sp. TaxID=1931238 RepID=UPI00261A1E75|nr:hypothetical protein [Pelagibius sp.]